MKNHELLTQLRRIEAELLGGKEPSAFITLQSLITEVEDEIRDESNKENGRDTVAKAAKSILKSASLDKREAFHKAFRSLKGLLICDGFRAVRFKHDTAPELVEHRAAYQDYPDIDRIIDDAKRNDVPVNVPSLGDVRAFIKIEKARLKATKQKGMRLVLTDANGVEIHVDPTFLVDMLEALPGATVTSASRSAQVRALYFAAENGDGVLLPLRPPKKTEE